MRRSAARPHEEKESLEQRTVASRRSRTLPTSAGAPDRPSSRSALRCSFEYHQNDGMSKRESGSDRNLKSAL
jgi:hypothetical protein